MVCNADNKQRRLIEFKDGCRYGKFGKTKAYELIARERIRAYKMGGKTMIHLDSVDEISRLAAEGRIESKLADSGSAPLGSIPVSSTATAMTGSCRNSSWSFRSS